MPRPGDQCWRRNPDGTLTSIPCSSDSGGGGGPSYCETCNCHTMGACRFCPKCRDGSGSTGGGGSSGAGGGIGGGGGGGGGGIGGGGGGGTPGIGIGGGGGVPGGETNGGTPGVGPGGNPFLRNVPDYSDDAFQYHRPLEDYWSRLSVLMGLKPPGGSSSYRGPLSYASSRSLNPQAECKAKGGVWHQGNPLTGERPYCETDVIKCINGFEYICNVAGSGKCVKSEPEKRCLVGRPPGPPNFPSHIA